MCPRKDRGPNWLLAKVLALVDAMQLLYLEDLDTVDAWDLMTSDATKWKQVSDHVMRVGFLPCLRDGPACKTKWNQVILNYRQICDDHSRNKEKHVGLLGRECSVQKSKGVSKDIPERGVHCLVQVVPFTSTSESTACIRSYGPW